MKRTSRRPIAKIDPETEAIIEIYPSQREAARLNKCWDSHLSKVLKGSRHLAGGYKWLRINPEDDV